MNCEQCDKPVSQNWGLKLCPECARSETSPPKPSEPIELDRLRTEIAHKELEHFIYRYKLTERQAKELNDIVFLCEQAKLEWVKSLP